MIQRLALFSCLLLLAFATPGCKSFSGPASASFASVVITDHSPQQVAEATAKVFEADGYRGRVTGEAQMVFEKEASRATTIARAGLVDTQAGAQTINRVRVQFVPLSGGAIRIQCKAYMVSGGNDEFMQDEVAVSNMRSRPYQNLLDKIAKSLN